MVFGGLKVNKFIIFSHAESHFGPDLNIKTIIWWIAVDFFHIFPIPGGGILLILVDLYLLHVQKNY